MQGSGAASLLDAALQWASGNFRVFPLQARSKNPRSVQEVKWIEEATSNPETIRSWWTRWPDANIGVLCDNMIVVDVDAHKGGLETLPSLNLPLNTLTVRTPRGGLHLYYNGPSRSLSSKDLGPGIDIRSYHGFVLAPGSYVEDKGVRGFYRVEQWAFMAPAPIEFVQRLDPPRERVTTPAINPEIVDSPLVAGLVSRFLREQAELAVAGSQDNTCFQVAAVCKDYGASPQLTKHLMQQLWLPRQYPPIALDTLYQKVDNAYEYGKSPIGAANPTAHFADVFTHAPAQQIINGFAPQPQSFEGVIRIGGYLPRSYAEIPALPWLMPNLLLRRECAVLAAPGGAGKSTFLLTIAAHGACGRPYLGMSPTQPFRTLVYEDEDSLDVMRERLKAIVEGFHLDEAMVNANVGLLSKRCLRAHGKDLRFAIGGRQLQPNTPNIEALRAIVAAQQIDVLCIAPLNRIHDADDSDPVAVRVVMETLADFAHEANLAVLLAHHTPKGAKAGTSEALKGSVDIVNATRVAFTLFPADEDDIKHYALPRMQRNLFLRLDNVKANYSLIEAAPKWLKRHSFTPAETTRQIGILIPADLDNERVIQAQELARALVPVCLGGTMPPLDAAKIIMRSGSFVMDDKELARRIEILLAQPVAADGRLVYVKRDGTKKFVVVE